MWARGPLGLLIACSWTAFQRQANSFGRSQISSISRGKPCVVEHRTDPFSKLDTTDLLSTCTNIYTLHIRICGTAHPTLEVLQLQTVQVEILNISKPSIRERTALAWMSNVLMDLKCVAYLRDFTYFGCSCNTAVRWFPLKKRVQRIQSQPFRIVFFEHIFIYARAENAGIRTEYLDLDKSRRCEKYYSNNHRCVRLVRRGGYSMGPPTRTSPIGDRESLSANPQDFWPKEEGSKCGPVLVPCQSTK